MRELAVEALQQPHSFAIIDGETLDDVRKMTGMTSIHRCNFE
jgi:hypothetical protein